MSAGTYLKRIFHPSDFSAMSAVAFIHALKIAVAAQGGLTILHTGSDRHAPEWEKFPQVRETLTSWGLLPPDSEPAAVAQLGLDVRKVATPHRDPVSSILHYLERHPNDLIVLAAHHYEGLAGWFHKSVATPLALSAGALTLFLPENVAGFVDSANGNARLRRVLIPVDAEPAPQLAVAGAGALAGLLGAEEVTFTLFHAGPESTFPPVPRVPERSGWKWRRVAAPGRVEQAILQAAQENGADLIVMATAGHHGFMDALRGSTTERIVRTANCPVLAVPAYERVPVLMETPVWTTLA